MQSAPHTMPAMIEVNLPAGFTAPDLTRVLGSCTCSPINSERPVCSASSSTGTNPAADTRFRSSNTAESTVNVCDDCIESAFQNSGQMRPQQPQLSQFRRHFRCSHADQTTGPSTIQAKPEDGFDAMAPENVSPLVVWLGSAESRDVTGKVFEVEAGLIRVAEGWVHGPQVDKGARWDPSELGPVVADLLAKARPPVPVYGA